MNADLLHAVPSTPARAPLLDKTLVRKYGGNGPRYTSYPTADRFTDSFDARSYREHLAQRNAGGLSRSLGLYLHVPFCDTLCFYCACNKIATRNRALARAYVADLEREIALVGDALGGSHKVSRMHWGGGTPTFLTEADSARLVERLKSTFDFAPNGEYAIEIDPRRAGPDRIAHLSSLGFNRMSVGVQDFDQSVQRAVNRVQSVDETLRVIEAGRRHGFRSINLDLIFGLPKQTEYGFAETLERVIDCDPDRVALYAYAHLPSLFTPQRRIVEAELPGPELKLGLLAMAIERLDAAGYVYVGMDHFAKPTDELAVAQRNGTLTRDFQGYSSGGPCDLVGFGVSAIGTIGSAYAQNAKALDAYRDLLDRGELPVVRGVALTHDDLVRRAVIQALACQFVLAKESIAIAYLIDFDRYFAPELAVLERLADDGLVELDRDWITVTARGRLLVRAVCMVFDRYLREARSQARYSRVM